MSGTTTTRASTAQRFLDNASPEQLGELFQAMQLGRLLKPIKVTVSGVTAAAAQNITTIPKSKITVNFGLDDITLTESGGGLPPILVCTALRVAGGGTAGPYVPCDTGATAVTTTATYPGTAKLSDDGKTITFLEATVTGFVIEYIPRSAYDLGSPWPKL